MPMLKLYLTFDSGFYSLKFYEYSDRLLSSDILQLEDDNLVDVTVLRVAFLLYLGFQFVVNLTRTDHVLTRIKRVSRHVVGAQA